MELTYKHVKSVSMCYVYVCLPLERAGQCGFAGQGVTSGNQRIGDEQLLSQKGPNSSCKESYDEFVMKFGSSKTEHQVRSTLTKQPRRHCNVFFRDERKFCRETIFTSLTHR